MRKRVKKILKPLVPSIVYNWRKRIMEKLEIYRDCEVGNIPTDMDKLPEIPQHKTRLAEIPISSGWVKRLHEKHLKKDGRNGS